MSERTRVARQVTTGRIWFAAGLLFLAYAFLGNYVALPGYLRFLGRGGRSGAGNTLDAAVVIGAVKMVAWMFSFQLGVLCLAFAALRARDTSAVRSRRLLTAAAVAWLAFWAVPRVPGPYPAYFAVLGLGILALVALTLWSWADSRLRLPALARPAHDLRLFGYLFFAIATWDVCGIGSTGRMLHPEEVVRLQTGGLLVAQATKLIIELVLAWLFTFLAGRAEQRIARSTPSPP